MQILFSSTVDESSFSPHPHQLCLFLVIFSVLFPLVTGDISLPYDLIYLVINDEHFYIPIGHTNMKKCLFINPHFLMGLLVLSVVKFCEWCTNLNSFIGAILQYFLPFSKMSLYFSHHFFCTQYREFLVWCSLIGGGCFFILLFFLANDIR